MRRSEIVALMLEDLTWADDGVRVLIPQVEDRPGRAGAGDRGAVPGSRGSGVSVATIANMRRVDTAYAS
jgi:hypothetical protein